MSASLAAVKKSTKVCYPEKGESACSVEDSDWLSSNEIEAECEMRELKHVQ